MDDPDEDNTDELRGRPGSLARLVLLAAVLAMLVELISHVGEPL